MYSYTSTVVRQTHQPDETQLKITNGLCHPYPAVDEDGNISGGLKHTGPRNGKCEGSALGSQIYSRNVVFWTTSSCTLGISRKAQLSPYILIIHRPTTRLLRAQQFRESPSRLSIYQSDTLLQPKDSNGSSFKCTYTDTGLKATEDSGEFQDLSRGNNFPTKLELLEPRRQVLCKIHCRFFSFLTSQHDVNAASDDTS
ncbi:Necrosis inducing protein [Phytophthora cactorum]|nr:Necrosis inducing protein [Phytophthora cactorum]